MTRTIAILGGTGQTGRGVIKGFLEREDVSLRLYVRSKSKLAGLFPSIEDHPRVTIIEGSITDVDTIAKCLQGAQTIISTIGHNDNRQGVHSIEDAARSIVAALELLANNKSGWQLPLVLQLSSATWSERISKGQPAPILWLVRRAFYYPYADLVKAHEVFHAAPHVLKLLLVFPPAIVDDKPSGHTLSPETVGLTVSYADLAAGFVELASEDQYREVTGMGVSSKDGDSFIKYGPEIFRRMIIGFCGGYIPGFWGIYDALFG